MLNNFTGDNFTTLSRCLLLAFPRIAVEVCKLFNSMETFLRKTAEIWHEYLWSEIVFSEQYFSQTSLHVGKSFVTTPKIKLQQTHRKA